MAMSQGERDWLNWLKRARDGVLAQRQAAEKMGVTERWVRELLGRMESEGDGVVVHGLRGAAIQPADWRAAAGEGDEDAGPAGVARLWADVCEPAIGQAA